MTAGRTVNPEKLLSPVFIRYKVATEKKGLYSSHRSSR